MGWVSYQIKQKDSYFSPPHQPHYSLPQSSPPPLQSGTHSRFNILNNISPSILIIITIVAIVFFISGLLHLLTRFFLRPINRDHSEDLNNVSSPFHGQLQQLFQLHASGLDQLYIDSLPVFFYKTIIGLKKNPFDCAVCLCEFEDDDLLRLLPKCSHAFHVKCIDTWLLSHSNCPLCRGSLVPEFPSDNIYSSNSESSREIVSDISATSSVLGINAVVGIDTQVDFHGEDELGLSCNDISINFSEISHKEDEIPAVVTTGLEEKVIPVKLGKFRNVDIVTEGVEDGSFNSKIVARRCFSMGSLEYSLDENSSLKVPIILCVRKHTSKKPSLPLKPGHHLAMSECEGFKGFDSSRNIEICGGDNEETINTENANKKDSFSVSKIWLFSKKEKKTLLTEDSSRRASSFRFPLQQTEVTDDLKLKCGGGTRRTVSEIDVSEWEMNVSELGVDEEVGSNMLSFARRTLLWFVGKQNKVVHSSSSPNV